MLSSVVVEEEEVLSHITGKWMSPLALRAALKRAGVNIFPAEYSPKYVPVPRKVSDRGSWWLFPFFHSGHPLLHWEHREMERCVCLICIVPCRLPWQK